MKINRKHREAYRLIEAILLEEGATRIELEQGGKHPRVRFVSKEGKQCLYVFAGTPSDGRARKNMEAGVRRVARGGTDSSRNACDVAPSGCSST